MTPAIAGAPVSFGVFEMTPEGSDTVAPQQMLRILGEAGFDGVDLGPVGYFGDDGAVVQRLRAAGLGLAGGWVQLPMVDDDAFEAALPALHRVLATFAAAAQAVDRAPLPTLADNGSARRRAAPGRGAQVDPLDDAAWARLAANAQRAAEIVRAAGLEPTFHHHAGTYVESPAEIDRFLGSTDVGLTLDVGHLAIAGGDLVAAVHRWGARVNHLHLKDVDRAVLRRVVDAGGGMSEVWMSGAFTALGEGDLDLAGALDAMMDRGFDGWIVVEQDVLNKPGVDIEVFQAARAADQRRSLEFLQHWV